MDIRTKLIATGCCLLLSIQAAAEKPRFGDTLSFSLGGMNHKGEASFSSTRDGNPIDELNFPELGVDDRTSVVWADFTWQFADRWQFSLNYSSFEGNGFKTATDGGNFGGIDWQVGAALTTDFDMKLYIADVTWDFVKTDKAHIGIGAGLHAADLDMGLLAEVAVGIGGIGGIGGTTEIRSDRASVLAPLPNISMVGGVMLGEKVYLSGHAGYFSLSYDKYDGELISLRGSLEWRPWEHVGLGAAYQYVDIDLEVDDSDSQDFFDMKFYGPILFLSVGF